MSEDFFATLIGNPSRARLLRLFVANPSEVLTLAQAARRAGVSTPAAGKEIRFLENLGLIKKGRLSIALSGGKRAVAGKQKEDAWSADPSFKYLAPLSKFLHEVSPVHHESILSGLKGSGRFKAAILSGSFMGDPSRPADLLVAADALNEDRLEAAVRALERQCGREIRYAAFSTPEFRYRLTVQDRLIRDTLDFPHLVLLDKGRLL